MELSPDELNTGQATPPTGPEQQIPAIGCMHGSAVHPAAYRCWPSPACKYPPLYG
jgi:hypothetical protein